MKTPHDHDLASLLRRADPAADAPGCAPEHFAAAVRARILVAERADVALQGHPTRHFMPLAAALALLASLGAGSFAAQTRQERARTELFASAYARSIDPWLMHSTSPDRP